MFSRGLRHLFQIYCYSDKGVTHITEPEGVRIVRFSDGREERHLPDGTKKVRVEGMESVSSPDGQRIANYADGTRLVEQSDGDTTVFFNDGSKETRCQDYTVIRDLLLLGSPFYQDAQPSENGVCVKEILRKRRRKILYITKVL